MARRACPPGPTARQIATIEDEDTRGFEHELNERLTHARFMASSAQQAFTAEEPRELEIARIDALSAQYRCPQADGRARRREVTSAATPCRAGRKFKNGKRLRPRVIPAFGIEAAANRGGLEIRWAKPSGRPDRKRLAL